MRIIADQEIPQLDFLLGSEHRLSLMADHQITRTQLQDADILLIRSTLRVDAALLQGTSVRFVGSMASGTDHLDTEWLQQAGITWATASGANAEAVVEYVLCCLARLDQLGHLKHPSKLRAAVIGVGRIGQIMADCLRALGFSVLVYDPPRAERDTHFLSNSFIELQDLDLISLHCELTERGGHPTYHLINHDFLARQKPGCVLINAARGAVLDSAALLVHDHLLYCLDVWEHEPNINTHVLAKATLATPHIAGYSLAAKYRAVFMVYQQLATCFGWSQQRGNDYYNRFVESADTRFEAHHYSDWQAAALSLYDPILDTRSMHEQLLRRTVDVGLRFKQLRSAYLLRREGLLAHFLRINIQRPAHFTTVFT